MKDEEKRELEQEYENLKLLASFHEAYGVPENAKERKKPYYVINLENCPKQSHSVILQRNILVKVETGYISVLTEI